MIIQKLLMCALVAVVLSACTSNTDETTESAGSSDEKIDNLVVKDSTIELEGEYVDAKLKFLTLSAGNNNRALDSVLYENVSFYSVTGADITDIKAEFEELQSGLVEMEYVINYNQDGVFDVSYDLVYLGAHLSYDYVNRTIDLHNASRVHLVDMLDINKLQHFIDACNEKMKDNIAEAKKNVTEEDEDILSYYDGNQVEEKNLEDFSITSNGIVVYYDFHFPHFAKFHEPSSIIRFTWSEMEKYLDLNNEVVKRIYHPGQPESVS